MTNAAARVRLREALEPFVLAIDMDPLRAVAMFSTRPGVHCGVATRLKEPECELSETMDLEDMSKLFRGRLDLFGFYSTEVIESESHWGVQHAGMLENFAANIQDGTPLIAPGAEGINSVRLANAIHLSSWTGREVPFEFDDDEYLAELNKRIREEGLFPERT